jgi:xylose isomerase
MSQTNIQDRAGCGWKALQQRLLMLLRSVSGALGGRTSLGRVRCSSSWFEGIGTIPFEGPSSRNPLAFKHYNANEMIEGKRMRDWLRFSCCFWHTFRGQGTDPFGSATMVRPWDDGSETMENALRRVDAAFEFFSKLGVDWYTFHDVDVTPVGRDLAEFNSNFHRVAERLQEKQRETGVGLLWGTANLFSHPRYMNGAGTSPELSVFARAGAQVRQAMEVTHLLGGENYVFWGGREGYQTLWNTDVRQELDQMAALLRMAVEYREDLEATYQLLLEPKPCEPTKHQYDFDAAAVMWFLRQYRLSEHFKLNIEPNHTTLAGHAHEHDIAFASVYGMLGSVDANTGDELLGWDTDQFPSNVKHATKIMLTVMEQGGLKPGGLNFDAKVRRESTDLEDVFIGHIGAMDTFAQGLRAAAAIRADGDLPGRVRARYRSWATEEGRAVLAGRRTLQDMEKLAFEQGDVRATSGKQELFEMIVNSYCK